MYTRGMLVGCVVVATVMSQSCRTSAKLRVLITKLEIAVWYHLGKDNIYIYLYLHLGGNCSRQLLRGGREGTLGMKLREKLRPHNLCYGDVTARLNM